MMMMMKMLWLWCQRQAVAKNSTERQDTSVVLFTPKNHSSPSPPVTGSSPAGVFSDARDSERGISVDEGAKTREDPDETHRSTRKENGGSVLAGDTKDA